MPTYDQVVQARLNYDAERKRLEGFIETYSKQIEQNEVFAGAPGAKQVASRYEELVQSCNEKYSIFDALANDYNDTHPDNKYEVQDLKGWSELEGELFDAHYDIYNDEGPEQDAPPAVAACPDMAAYMPAATPSSTASEAPAAGVDVGGGPGGTARPEEGLNDIGEEEDSSPSGRPGAG